MPSEIYPEYFLIRVNEFNKVAVTPLEEWIEYLKTGIIRPDTTAPGLGEAREKLKYYSMTPQERHAYDEHLSALMIQNDVQRGVQRGVRKVVRRVVKRALKKVFFEMPGE